MNGTSLAAPQVAGLAALLIDRNSELASWPEASRAIIMASATHNIEGPRIIVRGQGDLKDGAGAIRADLADTTAQTRMLTTDPCYSLLVGIPISNTDFPVGENLRLTFHVDDTQSCSCGYCMVGKCGYASQRLQFTRLDTDLICSYRPDGSLAAISVSYDNNYEIVEFFAWQPGDYQIVVHKHRADEPSNYLGMAFVMSPLPHGMSLPLVMK
jgi:hypothetical protein